MLFALRLDETMDTESLILEAFQEWFRKIPTSVKDVSCSLEAQFLYNFSLVLLRVPIAVWAYFLYLKDDPAIVCLGPVRSSNLLSSAKRLEIECTTACQAQEFLRSSTSAKKKVTFAAGDSLGMI